MQKIVCDLCEGDIKGETYDLVIRCRKDKFPRIADVIFEDLCEKCAYSIRDMLKDNTPDTRHSGAAIKYDYAKILALKKAGWSNKKIADEMKCSTTTVQDIVSGNRKGLSANDNNKG